MKIERVEYQEGFGRRPAHPAFKEALESLPPVPGRKSRSGKAVPWGMPEMVVVSEVDRWGVLAMPFAAKLFKTSIQDLLRTYEGLQVLRKWGERRETSAGAYWENISVWVSTRHATPPGELWFYSSRATRRQLADDEPDPAKFVFRCTEHEDCAANPALGTACLRASGRYGFRRSAG